MFRRKERKQEDPEPRRRGLEEFAEIAYRLAKNETELLELMEHFIEHRPRLSRRERRKLENSTRMILDYVRSTNGELEKELENFRNRIALHRRGGR